MSSPVVVQLIGPMSGLPDFNRPTFNEWARKLRSKGYAVYNPAELPPGHDWIWYMKRTLSALPHASVAGLIHGWSASNGSVKEVAECKFFGTPLVPVHELCETTVDSEAGLPFEG